MKLMILLGEAIFVGAFCWMLYVILSLIMSEQCYLFWFILGFAKHFLGHYAGIHSYYCRYGNACNVCTKNSCELTNVSYLLPESVLEGLGFIIVGYGFVSWFKNKYVAVCVAGVLIHLLAELLTVHHYFCNTRCRCSPY
jgi:hypothetical protein